MIYDSLRSLLPGFLARYVMHFEAAIEDAVSKFAKALPRGARVLDAGAGETAHKHYFSAQRYCGLDLGIGDQDWDYSQLDVLGNLETLPFPDRTFDAAINIVTLEHVLHPERVICELGRVLAPGGRFLLVAPLQWEEHQQPHDYGRFTRFALDHLLRQAGFTEISIQPVGGIFRLISRRLLNALQFFPGPLMLVAAVFFAPPALVLPLLDPLDRDRSFTLGYICSARKPS
ncbi:MAG: methyltransferase domain-containing protein [Acidobacteriia bacterium]|nr:methyltransferase domain-containing protein [Terriglobia bacterium]